MVRLMMICVLVLAACGGTTGRRSTACDDADGCTQGDTRCGGSLIEICVVVANDCTVWQTETDCADTSAVCDASSGTPECATGCNDTCTDLGATQCSGDVVQQCQQGTDGCMAWGDGQNCASTGQVCDDSFQPVQCECDHHCTRAEDYCSDNTAWRCVENNFGCRSWQTTDCASETCYVGDDGATCGQACDAHSRGQCNTDGVCAPQVDANGLQAWICIDLLTDGGSMIPTVGAFAECDADPSDGLDNQCAEGAACQPRYVSDVVGECRSYCDASGTSSEPGATCPALVPDAALIGVPDWFAYGESSAWSTTAVAAGVALVEEPSTELALVATPLVEGNAATGIGYLEGSAPALWVTEDWDGDPAGPAGGKAGLRVTNVSGGSVDTALVIPLTAALAPGEAGAFVPFDFGATGTGFYLMAPSWWRFEHLATQDEPASESAEVIVFEETGPPPPISGWFENDVPADLDTTGAAFRVINGALDAQPLAVEFVAAADTDEVAVAESSIWSVLALSDGATVDVDVTLSWNLGGNSLLHTVVDVGRGDVVTLVTRNDPDVVDGVLIVELHGIGDPFGSDVAVRVTNVSTTTGLVYGKEDPLSTLGHRATLPAADGAIDVEPGSLALAVRAGGADASLAPAAMSGLVNLAAGDVASFVLHTDGGGALALLQPGVGLPTLPASGSGQTVVRFVNAAPGLGRLTLFSTAPLACNAWADDVGLCAWP